MIYSPNAMMRTDVRCVMWLSGWLHVPARPQSRCVRTLFPQRHGQHDPMAIPSTAVTADSSDAAGYRRTRLGRTTRGFSKMLRPEEHSPLVHYLRATQLTRSPGGSTPLDRPSPVWSPPIVARPAAPACRHVRSARRSSRCNLVRSATARQPCGWKAADVSGTQRAVRSPTIALTRR